MGFGKDKLEEITKAKGKIVRISKMKVASDGESMKIIENDKLRFSERSKIAVTLNIGSQLGRDNQDIEIAVSRVVQEAPTNIHRYSGASRVRMKVSEGP